MGQSVYFADEYMSKCNPKQKLFLKFVTSSSRPPLLGFSVLEPKFSIVVDHGRNSSDLIQIDEYLAEEERATRASSFLPFYRRRQNQGILFLKKKTFIFVRPRGGMLAWYLENSESYNAYAEFRP